MNPFDKYFGPEDRLQIACCDYLDLQFPNLLYTHPANEAKRTAFERYKAKKLRMKSGVPDLLIFNSGKWEKYNGFAFELKSGKNKTTANQIDWMKRLTDQNWYVAEIRTFDEFKSIIDFNIER